MITAKRAKIYAEIAENQTRKIIYEIGVKRFATDAQIPQNNTVRSLRIAVRALRLNLQRTFGMISALIP
jgi:hypothetical protein